VNPLRYRLALLAYPARYRTARGPELLATLADGDDDRGGASSREALALVYRGFLQRGRIALSGDGLLVVAATLVVIALFFGLTWAERVFLFRGGVAATLWTGPGTWPSVGLTVAAFTILAAGPGRAVDDARRRRIAACVAFFGALLIWSSPGSLLKHSLPSPHDLLETLKWIVPAVWANWEVTLPFAAATGAGTWLALLGLACLPRPARRPALAAGLFAAGAIAVGLTWARPDLPAEYGRSAFADLGAGIFVTTASMLLALVASRRRGSNQLDKAAD
jgi:hypothetical protein